MRRATRTQVAAAIARAAPRQRVQLPIVRTIGAPTGGLNGRDALDDMGELDAIKLDNWIPGFGKVMVRPGSAEHAQVGVDDGGFVPETAAVETLAALNLAAGAKMVAAAGDAIWDVTATGDEDTPLDDGYSNARWQTVNMNDTLGMVNGEDTPQVYDGSTVGNMTVSGSGLTVTDLIGVDVFKSRSYFVEAASQSFWYSAVLTLGGVLTEFPLGDVGTFGGFLMATTSWSRDSGAGMDDLFVAIMSSGEVIVYAGSDPGDADDWFLVGVFRIGAPLGRRCVTRVGGETVIATVDGPVVLSKVLPGGRMARDVNVSNKLGKLLTDQAANTGSSFGWQPFLYPREKFALVNYPTGGEFEQFIVNLQTGAWAHLEGWNASCWGLLDDVPYFGTTTGRVFEAFVGVTDDGVDVIADGIQAFNYLGSRNVNKQVTMVSPLLEVAAAVPVSIGLAADFAERPQATVNATIGAVGGGGTPWGSPWGSPWSTPVKATQSWLSHSARGYAISPSLRAEQTDKRIAWSALRIAFEKAGMI